MRKVDAKIERAANQPLNQFLTNDTVSLALSGGSWPLSRLLRQAEFTVGDAVVIIQAEDFRFAQSEFEKLAEKLAGAEKKLAKKEDDKCQATRSSTETETK